MIQQQKTYVFFGFLEYWQWWLSRVFCNVWHQNIVTTVIRSL